MKIVYSQTDNVYDDLAADEMRVYDNEGNHIDSEYVGPLCECPEDAIIGRDLISCSTIIEYMKKAYEAGVDGEPFIVEEVEWVN